MTAVATPTQEPVLETPALEVIVKLLLHISRQGRTLRPLLRALTAGQPGELEAILEHAGLLSGGNELQARRGPRY